ncbi:expressed unknown protein [Seminavis robusta]|uniref:Uncharacterized protein n=1 Tax=Seminavis robusta TaxID=568900 RepID=A0A9N8DW52_9STRA|nr:expressed unknown protein [Seminavis robusta]|eukprot:Sro419_g139070.1 n/a (183) ;mRNA; f:31186-31734
MVAVKGPDGDEEETKNHVGDDSSAPSEALDSLSSTFDHALSTCKETLLQMLHDREFEEVKEKLLAIDSLKKTVNEAMKEASMAPAPRFSRAMLDASEVSQTEKAILSPDLWAITYDQLMHVDALAARLFGRSYSKKTMRDINKRMIEPLCKRTWTSYALSLNPLGLKLDVFITHSWYVFLMD